MDREESSIEPDFQIKVYRPAPSEFANMKDYIQRLEKDSGTKNGICKIIPPAGWLPVKMTIPDNFSLTAAMPTEFGIIRNGIHVIRLGDPSLMTYGELITHSKQFSSFDVNPENSFWNKVKMTETAFKNTQRPIYAIDNEISLFDDSVNDWNLNRLTKEHSIIHDLQADIPGVLTPFVNAGMKYTAFGWHVEDGYLASVNVLHSGASKYWYCVPHSESERLEKFCAQSTTEYKCNLLLRHKLFLIAPSVLKENEIKFSKIEQREGEIIVTFPGAYHSGFNTDLNLAEAVNIGTKSWPHLYSSYKTCDCLYSQSSEELHSILKHHTVTSEDTEITWQCDSCDSYFTQRRNLHEHMKIYHADHSRRFVCSNCHPVKYFTSKYNFQQHFKTSHSELSMPTEMETKYVKPKPRKNAAPNVSTTEKLFVCPHCGLTTKKSSNLTRHIIRKHEHLI